MPFRQRAGTGARPRRLNPCLDGDARRDSGCRRLRTLQAGWDPGIEVAANRSRQTIVIDQHAKSWSGARDWQRRLIPADQAVRHG